MGTIFKELEDGYVQNATVFNVCMYMMNNTLVRNYTKSEPRTLGDILDFIDTYKEEIEDSFRYSAAYNFQDDDERTIAINTFIQMFSVFKKAVSNTELEDIIFKDSSWNVKYENEEFANYCTNGAVFESATEVYVVFEGTIDAEWLDNGEGLSQDKSDQQENALAYFNLVAQENGWTETDTVIVSGHSKGGNKAQYITLYAEDADIIDYCISVNGQGFSNLEEEEHYTKHSKQQRQEAIDKMYSLCGEYDYVHGLGNVIIPDERTIIIDLDNDKFYENIVAVGHCMPWFFYRDGEFHGDLNPIGEESSLSGLVTEASNRVMELSDSELEYLTLASI